MVIDTIVDFIFLHLSVVCSNYYASRQCFKNTCLHDVLLHSCFHFFSWMPWGNNWTTNDYISTKWPPSLRTGWRWLSWTFYSSCWSPPGSCLPKRSRENDLRIVLLLCHMTAHPRASLHWLWRPVQRALRSSSWSLLL